MNPKILAIGLAMLCVSARAADLIPVEDFARMPSYSDLKMSPDGEYVGFIREHEGVRRLCFSDVATMKMVALALPKSGLSSVERQVFGFEWLGASRALVLTNLGWAATDRDRKNFKDFGWQNSAKGVRVGAPDRSYGSVVHILGDDRRVLGTNHRFDHGRDEMQYPEVMSLDTVSGTGTTLVKNPGNVLRWLADAKGLVRAGVVSGDKKETVICRSGENEEFLPVNDGSLYGFEPKGFSEDGRALHVITRPETGAGALHAFDLEKSALGEAIWKNPVDEPGALVLDPQTRKLVGVRYEAEYQKTYWIDSRYAAFQAAVDKVLPGRVNLLVDFSQDLGRVLVKSSSDRVPPVAYVYNSATGELREIGKTCAWIKSEQMALVRPISLASRDGVRLYGYITIPNGVKPEGLPMVVLMRDGLRGRTGMGFDPLVQFFANRGYAVLQVNHRGSSGYGWAFRRLGDGETGGKVQADIEDATRWAVSKKIATPGRIAVVGARYGGYSVLHALGKTKDLYTCGVAIAPISDWASFLKRLNPETGIFYRLKPYSEEVLVDATMNIEQPKEESPVNFAADLRAPVLIVKREDFGGLWAGQAQAMIKALEKAGRFPETYVVKDADNGRPDEQARVAELKAIEAFLAKHLGAGVSAEVAK